MRGWFPGFSFVSLGVVALGSIALVTSVAGCTATSDDGSADGDSESALSQKYDVTLLLEDDDVRGGEKLTTARIQNFLEDKGSYLASYSEGGKTAAEIIAASCKRWNISPIYMLARIQIESSLVTSGTSRSLKAATGCACPDGASCSRSAAGFSQQVECAANLHASYFDEMERDGVTRADWGVGKRSRTLDPCSVTPRSKATAALYTYTPWVGPYGKQCSSHGSSGLTTLVQIYKGYEAELGGQ